MSKEYCPNGDLMEYCKICKYKHCGGESHLSRPDKPPKKEEVENR